MLLFSPLALPLNLGSSCSDHPYLPSGRKPANLGSVLMFFLRRRKLSARRKRATAAQKRSPSDVASTEHRFSRTTAARELPVERWWLRLAPPRDGPSEPYWPIPSSPGARPAPLRMAAQLRGERATARFGPPGVFPCLLAGWAGRVARTRRVQTPNGPRNAPGTPARSPVATPFIVRRLAAEAIGGSERSMASLVAHSHDPGLLFRRRCRLSVHSTGPPNPTPRATLPAPCPHGLRLIIYNT